MNKLIRKAALAGAAIVASAGLMLGGALPAQAATSTYTHSCAGGLKPGIVVNNYGTGSITVKVYNSSGAYVFSNTQTKASFATQGPTSPSTFVVTGAGFGVTKRCI